MAKKKPDPTAKIEMLSTAAGPGLPCLRKGFLYDLPQAEADALVDGGYAKAIQSKELPLEKAVKEDLEVPEKQGRKGK